MAEQPVGNEGFISEIDVRIFMRDSSPEANVLLGDYEFSPEEIRTAQTLCVDRWNDTPPQVGQYTVTNFPWRYFLLMGTVANLLTIAAHGYRRNHLTYNVPGGSINDQDKAPAYDATAARLGKDFGDWLIKQKVAQNMNQGWGWV
jgi:hypothetical protein